MNITQLCQGWLIAASLLAMSVLHADETEIYFADKSGEVTPNVLFLIDGSGSMAQVVSGDSSGRTRMQVLKDAFGQVMTDAPSNVNIGLMHYANHGLGDDYWWSSIKGVNFPATDVDTAVEPLIAPYKSTDNLPDPASATTPVRTFLSNIVSSWDSNGYTPIVDSLYEAARYFRGDSVGWGRDLSQLGWSAHPLSYSGSSISCSVPLKEEVCVKTWGMCNTNIVPGSCKSKTYSECCNWIQTNGDGSGYCKDNNYSCSSTIEECKHYLCDSITGTPQYKSPIGYSCQANYLVIMSDGKPEYPYYPGLGDVDGTKYYPPSVKDPAATEQDALAHTAQIKVATKVPDYIGQTCEDKPLGYASGTCGKEITH